MRFPSIDALATRAREVAARFPVPLLTGATATALTIASTYDGTDQDLLVRLAMVVMLGLPASFGIAVLAETRVWPNARHAVTILLLAVALAGFYLVWPGPDEKHHMIRYLQLSAALHLSAAFLPALGQRESAAFWHYNRSLFLSFLRAAVFSAVLFHGLAIAVLALDKLFGVDVPGETYLRLWLFTALLGNTWIFLAGIPRPAYDLPTRLEYPRFLKVFTQYVLTPLVTVYLVILLAYLVKVVATGQWPSGWIGYLVTAVAIAGILGFLLVHPLRAEEGEAWIRTYVRWVYLGLIPAAAILLVALWKRIEPYGLTELRYLGVALALWLLGIALLYSLRRTSGISVIPKSLCLVLLITLFGPLGATTRSVTSQRSRLAEAVSRHSGGSMDSTGSEAGSSALRYLIDHRATPAIATAFGGTVPGNVDLDSLPKWRTDSVAQIIMSAAGMKYLEARWQVDNDDYFDFSATRQPVIALEGYAWLVRLSRGDSAIALPNGDTLRIAFDSSSGYLRITGERTPALTFDLARLVDSLGTIRVEQRGPRPGMPAEEMRLPAVGGDAVLLLSGIGGERKDGAPRITRWNGSLLLPSR